MGEVEDSGKSASSHLVLLLWQTLIVLFLSIPSLLALLCSPHLNYLSFDYCVNFFLTAEQFWIILVIFHNDSASLGNDQGFFPSFFFKKRSKCGNCQGVVKHQTFLSSVSHPRPVSPGVTKWTTWKASPHKKRNVLVFEMQHSNEISLRTSGLWELQALSAKFVCSF